MREILFRGKRYGDGHWVKGYYRPYSDKTCFIGSYQPTPLGKSSYIYDTVDLETVGQLTCLFDKNDAPIYEGDIVKVKEHGYIPSEYLGEVVFHKGGYCVKHKYDWSKDYSYHRIGSKTTWRDMNASGTITYTYEIMGNIHDNPELLKGETE